MSNYLKRYENFQELENLYLAALENRLYNENIREDRKLNKNRNIIMQTFYRDLDILFHNENF